MLPRSLYQSLEQKLPQAQADINAGVINTVQSPAKVDINAGDGGNDGAGAPQEIEEKKTAVLPSATACILVPTYQGHFKELALLATLTDFWPCIFSDLICKPSFCCSLKQPGL